MKPLTHAGTRGVSFWLIVLASTLGNLVNSASAPLVSSVVQRELGGDAALAGLLVSLSAFASIVAMPVAGGVIDRFGVRPVVITAAAISVVGLAIVLIGLSMPSLATGRLLFGAGNSAVATALTTWVVVAIPRRERGRALSLFGLSVWVGLALGPVLGENISQTFGYDATWVVAIVLQLIALLVALGVPAPTSARGSRASAIGGLGIGSKNGSGLLVAFRPVWIPGAVAMVAWAGEGFMMAFLIQHLVRNGLSPDGVLGAASVFTVFAAAVIVTRLVLGGLPDRIGAVATARFALIAVGSGLAVLAISQNFAVAAIGAVLIGTGYAPLYPALTMLATEDLAARRHGTGLGLFSSMTSIGHAGGSLIGGLLVMAVGESTTLLILAAAQFLAIILLRRRRSARTPAGDDAPSAS